MPYAVNMRAVANVPPTCKRRITVTLKADRPDGEKKQIVHFARNMAGILGRISPACAIDFLTDLKHGANCQCVSCSVKRAGDLEKLINERYGQGSGVTPSS